MNTPSTSAAAREPGRTFVVFSGGVRVATGGWTEAALAAQRALERNPRAAVVVFDRASAEVVDLDFRGTEDEVRLRYAPPSPPSSPRGRPKLGVIPREVTLLPRHWDWLARQPGGASAALRKLVDAARRTDPGAARAEAAYRFMSVLAGDLPGFEEAARALFAGARDRLEAAASPWPVDIREEALRYLDEPPVAGAED